LGGGARPPWPAQRGGSWLFLGPQTARAESSSDHPARSHEDATTGIPLCALASLRENWFTRAAGGRVWGRQSLKMGLLPLLPQALDLTSREPGDLADVASAHAQGDHLLSIVKFSFLDAFLDPLLDTSLDPLLDVALGDRWHNGSSFFQSFHDLFAEHFFPTGLNCRHKVAKEQFDILRRLCLVLQVIEQLKYPGYRVTKYYVRSEQQLENRGSTCLPPCHGHTSSFLEPFLEILRAHVCTPPTEDLHTFFLDIAVGDHAPESGFRAPNFRMASSPKWESHAPDRPVTDEN